MSRTGSFLALALLVIAPSAAAQEPSREELLQQLQKLQDRVTQLEAAQDKAATASAQAKVVDEMIADAQKRSRLMFQEGEVTSGFDLEQTKFFIRSADGNFLFTPGFLFQERYTVNHNSEDDDTENGFEIRRMRLILEGTAFTPDLFYKFQWESDFSDGDVFLQDAFVRYTFKPTWQLQLGQFYDVPYHEQTMFDQYLLAADRSFVNALIGGGQTDRVQGVMLIYDDKEAWRAQAVVHDGYNSDNTPFTNAGGTAFIGVIPTNWGVSGRAEYFAMGTRRAYEQFTAMGNTEDLLVFGAGADLSQAGDSDVLFHTIDMQYENTSGFGAYAAFLGMASEIGDDAPVTSGSYYNWGLLLQGNYMFTSRLEGFAQGNFIDADADSLPAGSEDQLYELLIGANYYFRGQNLKLTFDFGWLPNGSPIALPALGILAGDDAQFIFRGQFQLWI